MQVYLTYRSKYFLLCIVSFQKESWLLGRQRIMEEASLMLGMRQTNNVQQHRGLPNMMYKNPYYGEKYVGNIQL